MALVSVFNLSKSYVSRNLFSNVSFTIERSEKCGLVGVNGAGKSTLCRIIAAQETSDIGSVSMAKNTSISYLTQFFTLRNDLTVHEELVSNFERLFLLFEDVMNAAHILESDASAIDTYSRAWDIYERAGGLTYETEIKMVLSGLNLSDFSERKIATLSGGERMCVALAKILLSKADLIILDEPTNHLDIQSVQWLTQFLRSTESAVLLISHDRYVLDAVVKKVFDLDMQEVTVYSGNYSQFHAQKEARLELRERMFQQYKEEKEKLEEYVRKYKAGNRATMAKSREKRLNKLEVIENPAEFQYKLKLNFNNFKESGNDVLRLKNVSIRSLFSIEQALIRKGDRIGIVGLNGSGKTSLFAALLDSVPGVKWGQNIRIAYFDQHLTVPDIHLTMILFLNMHYDLDEWEAREVLGHFHFSGDDAFKTIETLSGGERARFKLLTMLLEEPNVIMMDEPTNHLDIGFLELIESALASYKGTLLVVSHDRYFLRSVATSLWIIRDSHVQTYHYDIPSVLDTLSFAVQGADQKNEDVSYDELKRLKNRIKKLEREVEQLEVTISDTEKRIRSCDEEMHAHGADAARLMAIVEEKQKNEQELNGLYTHWEKIGRELQDLLAEIRREGE